MTLAAARLGVSQSAVSQLILRLEQHLGCALLDREVRPAQLTHAGRSLLALAQDLLSHAQSVAEQVRSGALSAHPRIRLGCVDSFAATVGPALIHALSGDARELHLWSGLTPDLLTQLLARALDLVICTDAGTSQPRLQQTPLFAERFVLVLPPRQASLPLAQLANELPLIRYSLRSAMGQQVERYLRHVGVQAGRRFELDATDPLLSLVAAGVGWAISTPLCRPGAGADLAGHHAGSARVFSAGSPQRMAAARRGHRPRDAPGDAPEHGERLAGGLAGTGARGVFVF